VWEHLWRAALAELDHAGQLDWSIAFLDGSFAPAKNGGAGVGLTRKGKGTKWMLVVDGHGLPLGLHLASANQAEVRLAERTLASIRVARSRGRPKQRPAKLVADRGYDSAAFRQALRRRGMTMCIPPKRRPASWRAKRGRPVVARNEEYRLRYTVERSFAWLGAYRRRLIRWERLFVYRSCFAVALLRVCLRRAAPDAPVPHAPPGLRALMVSVAGVAQIPAHR
jgi:transposase